MIFPNTNYHNAAVKPRNIISYLYFAIKALGTLYRIATVASMLSERAPILNAKTTAL